MSVDFAQRLRRVKREWQLLRKPNGLDGAERWPTVCDDFVTMTAEDTRVLLLAQHDRLRQRTEACLRLAKLFETGEVWGAELDHALQDLRDEFAAHNASETRVISQLMHGPAAWGSLMIDRMLEEHLAEHAAFWELLSGTRSEVAGRIEDLADELEAHMAAEERTFLAPVTLRDDVIRTRTREGSY